MDTICELQVLSVLIWRLRLSRADGICINQQDDEEKTSQVRLMNYIYLCGTGVLIWLGKVDPLGAMRALHIACQLAAEETEKLESIQVSDPQEAVTPSTQGRPETESYFLWFNDELNEWTIMRPLKNLLIIPHYSSNPLYLEWLGPLFEAPWFQRVWVIQEYMMSNYADVFWGNAQFGFNLLAKAAKRIRDDHWPIFTHLFEAADGLSKCHELHRIRRDWEKSSFYDLLMLSKNRQATDPRDRIFALLGLPNHDMWSNTDFPVAPDYSLSMEEVYHITAIRLLVERNAVDVLAYVRHDPQDHETWASWVPDWTCCEEIGQTSIIKKVCGYIRAVVSVPTCAICYNERYAISIRGIVVDTIDTLAADIFDRMASTDPYDCSTLSHFRKGWLHAINAFINYYQPFFSDTILANSLTTGFGPGFRRILPYLHEDVQRFLAEYRIFVKYTQERKQSCAGYSEKTNSFVNVVCNTVAQRRFFVTSKGMLGLGPEKSREGDVVAVLFGGSTPYLLRPVRNGTHWRLVGECYVYDIMEGQAVTRWQGSNEPATDFHLY
jgi:hypothetical protein